MKLEKIVGLLFAGVIALGIYVYPINIKKEERGKEVIERYYDWKFPIQPYEITVKGLMGLDGMYVPPNLILIREGNEELKSRIHEEIHNYHFYTDWRNMLNRNYEERRTDEEEAKIMEELK